MSTGTTGIFMFRLKSPSLLIRVSHLILIQIIFIFSALVLVFLYPGNDHNLAKRYSNQMQNVTGSSAYIFKLLESSAIPSVMEPHLISRISQFVNEQDFIVDAKLIVADSITGRDSLIHLARSENDYTYSDTLYGSYNLIHALLKSGDRSCLTSMTEDGKYVIYYVRPESDDRDYALALATPNMTVSTGRNSQAYLLLLLFLISTLISLLIINLIFRGIKWPLSQLVEGFEKTASGHAFHIEERGDKQIRSLTRAFNEMSKKLNTKQVELASANNQLIMTNRSLMESESILTALVDYSPDAVIVTDLDDQVIIYNLAAARDFGYDQSDMMGKKISNLIPFYRNDGTKSDSAGNCPETQEVICRRKNGDRFPAVLVQTPLGLEDSQPMAILYFIRNISESRNYRQMILKLDRVASRGKMARDIAHEINNYLAILQGNLELIPMIIEKNDAEKLNQKVKIMKDTVGKISNFTDGLTRFSNGNIEFAKEDLNQLIENLVAFLKPQNKFDGITISTNLSENLPLVEVDSSQIQLLLVNLMTNSAEALGEMTDNRWIVISSSYDESSQSAVIKVADTGPGIAEENIDKLFVRRFSTKRSGTGLSLITCKNIVDNHKGEISFDSEKDSKSSFSIRIPVTRPIGEEEQDSHPADSQSMISIQK